MSARRQLAQEAGAWSTCTPGTIVPCPRSLTDPRVHAAVLYPGPGASVWCPRCSQWWELAEADRVAATVAAAAVAVSPFYLPTDPEPGEARAAIRVAAGGGS